MIDIPSFVPETFRDGDIVVLPTGRLARVLGYDGDGRCELMYLAEPGTEAGRVALYPKLLRKRSQS